MKILFIVQDYKGFHGVANVTRYLAEGLVEKEHEVGVLTHLDEGGERNECLNGVQIHKFDISQNILKHAVGEVKEYINFVEHYEADIMVFVCTECISTDLLLPSLHKIKAKKVLHIHGCSGQMTLQTSPLKKCDGFLHTIGHTYNWFRAKHYFGHYLKKYVNDFDAVMLLSDIDSGKAYIDQNFGHSTYVLGNAADDMFFKDYSLEPNPLDRIVEMKNKRYLVSCANYSVVKNQKGLIQEFYKSKISDAALVCIGGMDNSYYHDCKELAGQLASEYGEKEVLLLHHVERPLLPLIIGKASLYLVSSNREEYSISIIEAMAQGVPFISTNQGVAKLLPGGITINCLDEMHDTIDKLMSDSQQRTELADAGKQFAYAHCSRKKAVEKLENILLKVVNS